MKEKPFPKLQKQLSDFLYDEEGSIPRSKIVSVGTMILLLTIFYTDQALARHRSHKSHVSHRSHRSHVNGSQNKNSTPTPSPEPVARDVGMPSVPAANGKAGSGFSVVPVKGEEMNIVLTRLGEEGSAVPAAASSGVSAGIEAAIKANNGELPEITVGSSPASPGTLPDSLGDLLPGLAQVEFNMVTADNQFNPFVKETEFSMPSIPAGKPANTGILPKDTGKPVK